MLTLDDADLRQANPRRGITLAPPKGGLDLLRSREDEIPFGLDEKEPKLVLPVKAALASGRAPVDLDAAAATILLLGEEERLPDDPKVDDINETILAWFGDPELASRALARHLPLSFSQKARTGYLEAHRGKWLALARVLGRANNGDYARARETARAMRAESKSVAFRHAVAMAFPSEPWATEDARMYVAKKSEAEMRWYEKAVMLLCANEM